MMALSVPTVPVTTARADNNSVVFAEVGLCHLSTVVVGYQTLSLSIQKSIKMAPPTANPTTGKTHVAEKVKFHQGSLKPYSHEELGTADDVRS